MLNSPRFAIKTAQVLVSCLVLLVTACTMNPTQQEQDPEISANPPDSEISDGPPDHLTIDPMQVANAIPKPERLCTLCKNPYQVNGITYQPATSSHGYQETGVASWYGKKFHGRNTSTGEKYDMFAMTGAHRTLPIPSYAEVTNMENGKRIIVKINDRGPFSKERLIDLSYMAALKLDMIRKGRARVLVKAINGSVADLPTTNQTHPFAHQSQQTFLQIGAYRERPRADTLVKNLQLAGLLQTVVVAGRLEEQLIYRVRVGPLEEEQIEPVLEQLKSLGHNSVNLVKSGGQNMATDKQPVRRPM